MLAVAKLAWRPRAALFRASLKVSLSVVKVFDARGTPRR